MHFSFALLGLSTLCVLSSTSPVNTRRQIEQCEDGKDSNAASGNEGAVFPSGSKHRERRTSADMYSQARNAKMSAYSPRRLTTETSTRLVRAIATRGETTLGVSRSKGSAKAPLAEMEKYLGGYVGCKHGSGT